MINEQGFGITVVSNGRELPEIQHNGETFIAGVPGANFAIRMFVPTGKVYGCILKADDIYGFGNEFDGSPYPGSVDKKTSDPAENELGGPFHDGDFTDGLYAFAELGQDADGNNTGVLEARFYDNAYSEEGSRCASPSDKGSDLTTVVTDGAAAINVDHSHKYQTGVLLCTVRIRYATAAWLRQQGIAA